MSDQVIFEVPKEENSSQVEKSEKTEKKKKSRKPMTEDDKQALIQRLKAGRERKAKERHEKKEMGGESTQNAKVEPKQETRSVTSLQPNNKEEIKSLRDEIKQLKELMKEQKELSEKQEIRELIKEKESLKKELSKPKEKSVVEKPDQKEKQLPPAQKEPAKILPPKQPQPVKILKRAIKKWR